MKRKLIKFFFSLRLFFILLFFIFYKSFLNSQNTCNIYFEILKTDQTSIQIDVKANGFTKVLGFQMVINCDSNVLKYNSVSNINPSFTANFGSNGWNDNSVITTWIDGSLNGVTLPSGSVLFTLKYNYSGNPCDTTTLKRISPSEIFYSFDPNKTFPLNYSPKLVQIPGTNCVNDIPSMVLVRGGKFLMGCTSEQGSECDQVRELPVHAVQLDSFYIGKYEISQSEYQSIMGDNPSSLTVCGANCPVENASWLSSVIYCNELTLKYLGSSARVYYKDAALTNPWTKTDYSGNGSTIAGNVYQNTAKPGYRLPTEAEWEFGARGGILSKSYKYSGSSNLADVGWYVVNSSNSTHVRGTKTPNELGLYDMSGNVWEWVWDWWGSYDAKHACNPVGPANSTTRAARGGSYSFDASFCRNTYRNNYDPAARFNKVGFRIAKNK